jgi:hypothetical protein
VAGQRSCRAPLRVLASPGLIPAARHAHEYVTSTDVGVTGAGHSKDAGIPVLAKADRLGHGGSF